MERPISLLLRKVVVDGEKISVKQQLLPRGMLFEENNHRNTLRLAPRTEGKRKIRPT